MKKIVFLSLIFILVTACHEKEGKKIEVHYEPLAQQIDRCEFNDINPVIFSDYAISAELVGLKTKVHYQLFYHSGNNLDALLIEMSDEGFRQASFSELLSFHRQKKYDFPIFTPVLALGEWRRLNGEKYYPGAYGKRLNVYRILFNEDEKIGDDIHAYWIVLGIKM